MATVDVPITSDTTWYAQVAGSNFGNSGVRLQVGRKVASTSDVWINRAGLMFDVQPPEVTLATVTKVELILRARGTHSCFTIGGSPHIYVQKSTDSDAQVPFGNGQSGECSVGAAGGQDKYPGFTTTTTHQVAWNGSPAAGDTVTIDITTLWQDWWSEAGRSSDLMPLMLKSQDETNAAYAIAFDGIDGAGPPYLHFTYDSNVVPNVSSGTGRVPANASRITVAASQVFKAIYSDAEDNPAGFGPDFVYIQVANDNAFASLVHDVSLAPSSFNSSTKEWTANRTWTGTRGNTYYWRYRLTDHNGGVSAWSPTFTLVLNRVPTPTKVRPT